MMCFLPALLYFEDDLWLGALCWAMFLVPATLYGVYGIAQAFSRNWKGVVLGASVATGTALIFVGALFVELVTDPRNAHAAAFSLGFWLAALPLSTAGWAVLLAYLIPEQPRRPEIPPRDRSHPS